MWDIKQLRLRRTFQVPLPPLPVKPRGEDVSDWRQCVLQGHCLK
jgi:hypothetical protein